MISDSTILYLQIVASLFMATDYFFDTDQREKINDTIKGSIEPLNANIDAEIQAHSYQVRKNWRKILVSLAFVVNPLFSLLIYDSIFDELWVRAIVGLFSFALFGIGLVRLSALFTETIVPLLLAGVMRSITRFLVKCPKGSIFGVGFIILLISFFCRYINLS
jgi:hypothetical protein